MRDMQHATCDVNGREHGAEVHPRAVFGAAISICADWGVPVNFCGDRQTAKQFFEATLERCWRDNKESDNG